MNSLKLLNCNTIKTVLLILNEINLEYCNKSSELLNQLTDYCLKSITSYILPHESRPTMANSSNLRTLSQNIFIPSTISCRNSNVQQDDPNNWKWNLKLHITINKKTHAEEKVILITCRTCERQKVFPEDAPLSMIEPYVQECIACREEGRKH